MRAIRGCDGVPDGRGGGCRCRDVSKAGSKSECAYLFFNEDVYLHVSLQAQFVCGEGGWRLSVHLCVCIVEC